MRTLVIAALTLSLGCKKPVEAPAEVEELATFFHTQWADPEAMEAGVANLLTFVDTVDLSADWDERSYVVGGFTRADVEAFVEHDHDPADTVGVGLLFRSAFAVEDHMTHIRLEDQTPVEPSSPDLYTREWLEGDPDCVLAGGCESMRAMNDIERKNFLYTLRYDLDKYWRLIPTPDGRQALCARSFNVDETDNGNNIALLQGYSVDLFVPYDDALVRFQVAWQQTEIPGLDDEDMFGALAGGIDDVLTHQDAWLAGDAR